MHITINRDGETTVREETRDGDRYLIAEGVPIVTPTDLTNGYVPEESVANSVSLENTYGGEGWDGVPATLNHPRNLPGHDWYDPDRPDGQPVVSANVGAEEELGLGEPENDRWDGEYVRVDVAVNADRAEEMGGEAADVVAALENGDPLDVSTHYLGAELPPGEYDGEHREQAEAIVAPDALALLPNRKGQCSTEEGCGVNAPGGSATPLATANGVTVTVNAGHEPATANVTSDPAWSSLGGELNRIRDFVGQAIGSWRSLDRDQGGDGTLPREPTANTDTLQRVIDANGLPDETDHSSDQQTTGAESPVDDGSDQTVTANMDRDKLIRQITEHSNIKRESLEGMGDSCLQTTHENIVDDADGGDGDGDDDDAGDGDDPGADDDPSDDDTDPADVDPNPDIDTDGDVVVADRDELESMIEDQVEQRVAANEQRREREQRVDRIVANSAEYDEDDREELMETPDGVLDRIEQGLDAGTQFPATSGASPSANAGAGGSGNDVDLDDFDVGTGQITEIEAGGDD